MAKFKCRLCGETIEAGLLSRPAKYVCRKHKDICEKHVSVGWGSSKCEVCNKPVIKYQLNYDRKRWEKA
jgi:ribosomal protein L34E